MLRPLRSRACLRNSRLIFETAVWFKGLSEMSCVILESALPLGPSIYYVIQIWGPGRPLPPYCNIVINWEDPPPCNIVINLENPPYVMLN